MACHAALASALALDAMLQELSTRIGAEFGVTPEFSLCLNVGPAAFGRLGAIDSGRFIVAGSAIDTSARLRAVAVESGFRIILTVDVLNQAGVNSKLLPSLNTVHIDAVSGLELIGLNLLEPVCALLPKY